MTEHEQPPIDNEQQWQPLSPRFLPRSLASEALLALAIAVAAPVAASFTGGALVIPAWAWALLPAYLIVQLVVLPPAIRRAGYALREEDLQFRKGLFVHRRKAVPLRRVQHVETSRSPLDRVFGLSTIKLYTAAAGSGNLTIHGLDVATANRLRHHIVERVRGEATTDE